MKFVAKFFILLVFPLLSKAQKESYEDSLVAALSHAANDTIRLDVNRKLGFYHQDSDAFKALAYHEAQQALAKKLGLKIWEADAYQQIAYCYTQTYNPPKGFENYMQALKIAEDPASAKIGWGYANFSNSKSPDEARQSIVGMIHFELAGFYNLTRYKELGFRQSLEALKIGESIRNQKILSLATRDIGIYYFGINKFDSAFYYYQKALKYYKNSPYQKNLGEVYSRIGQYYVQKKQYDSAKSFFRQGLEINSKDVSINLQSNLEAFLGRVFMETGELDSALLYTQHSQELAASINDSVSNARAIVQLANIYRLKVDYATAYQYLQEGKNLSDTLTDGYIDKLMQFQNMDFDQKRKLQDLEQNAQLARGRTKMYTLLGGLAIFLLVGLLLFRNNRQKQRANTVLATTLDSLKATQSQLIQAEKMASLGELTAGIAHEIQNPLNFVNNFSEINKELVEELEQEIDKGNYIDAKAIAKDIKENEQKINHHGKRADAIVKGMLQHSQSSTGKKEPTDINALCDEYLRLSYHGLRAKDKSFNATMKTDFDNSIGNINIIPQDIGRVILNLLTNAFYVVDEKKKSGILDYEPTVVISTKKFGDKVEIKVSDNGNGIPAAIKEKIFQPFFTTKPTGQGTGLGLSLSYDIIKAHGGEIKVESKENNGTTFTIELPL